MISAIITRLDASGGGLRADGVRVPVGVPFLLVARRTAPPPPLPPTPPPPPLGTAGATAPGVGARHGGGDDDVRAVGLPVRATSASSASSAARAAASAPRAPSLIGNAEPAAPAQPFVTVDGELGSIRPAGSGDHAAAIERGVELLSATADGAGSPNRRSSRSFIAIKLASAASPSSSVGDLSFPTTASTVGCFHPTTPSTLRFSVASDIMRRRLRGEMVAAAMLLLLLLLLLPPTVYSAGGGEELGGGGAANAVVMAAIAACDDSRMAYSCAALSGARTVG